MTKTIVKLIGPSIMIFRLHEMGLFPGQKVRILRDGVWKINEQFTVGIRLTDVEIVLE